MERRKLDAKKKLSRVIIKPRDEWLEIPAVTPAIISRRTFTAAQKRLKLNSRGSGLAIRYLLAGHLSCRCCGAGYNGGKYNERMEDNSHHLRRYYRCRGPLKLSMPREYCHNHQWRADHLDSLVSEQIQKIFVDPTSFAQEITMHVKNSDQSDTLTSDLAIIDLQLKSLGFEQEKLLQLALKGFPEKMIVSENGHFNKSRRVLQARKKEIEATIQNCRETSVSTSAIENVLRIIQKKSYTANFESRRSLLNTLGIIVYLDGYNYEITGTLHLRPNNDDIHSSGLVPFSLGLTTTSPRENPKHWD
jgi:hypothetical protein